MQEKLELAQQILHVGQLCYKLMREGERIHPFSSAHEALYPAQSPLTRPSSNACPQVAIRISTLAYFLFSSLLPIP